MAATPKHPGHNRNSPPHTLLLLIFVLLTAITLAVGLVFTLAGSSALTFQVVSQLVQTVVGTAITVVGMIAVAIIYHDLGGESE